jgi:hypothetical protein
VEEKETLKFPVQFPSVEGGHVIPGENVVFTPPALKALG